MDNRLLSIEADSKTKKGSKEGYLTGILYLAPELEAYRYAAHTLEHLPKKYRELGLTLPERATNLCPFAGNCKSICLFSAGRGKFDCNRVARVAKTLWFLQNRASFFDALEKSIERLIRQAERQNMIPCVRLNGTSDLPVLVSEMQKRFPDLQFYDYTKIPGPWKRTNKNYWLSFSFDGKGSNWSEAKKALNHGINVTVCFEGKLPKTWRGYRVVDGDKTDIRFLDPKGVIVGLSPKGDAKKGEHKFVIKEGSK